MKIRVDDFDGGVKFLLTAQNEIERVLLVACIDQKRVLSTAEEVEFEVILPISNR
jgi:hypothetical protein